MTKAKAAYGCPCCGNKFKKWGVMFDAHGRMLCRPEQIKNKRELQQRCASMLLKGGK
jgi:hypothetical protein